jgi:hypothetical protein
VEPNIDIAVVARLRQRTPLTCAPKFKTPARVLSPIALSLLNQRLAEVPNDTRVTVQWTAEPKAGACTVTTSALKPGFSPLPHGSGSTGSFVTPKLANAHEPFDFTITCKNANGDLATATATAIVQLPK